MAGPLCALLVCLAVVCIADNNPELLDSCTYALKHVMDRKVKVMQKASEAGLIQRQATPNDLGRYTH